MSIPFILIQTSLFTSSSQSFKYHEFCFYVCNLDLSNPDTFVPRSTFYNCDNHSTYYNNNHNTVNNHITNSERML